jgi:hypothetical protein
MFFKACATLALASAAAAKPIVAPRAPEELPAYNRRSTDVAKRDNVFGNGNNDFNNGFNKFGGNNDFDKFGNNNDFDKFGNNDFDFNRFDLIDGFDNFRNQDTFLQVDANNVFIQQDRDRQRIIQEKVTQVLIVDQQNDFNRNREQRNLFRRANFRNNNRDRSTVILVVTQVNVVLDNGFGRQDQQQFFAQSAIVANRGHRETDTIQIFEARTLIEQDVFNNDRFRDDRNRGNFVFPTATGVGRSRQTAGVKIFDRRPTWSSTAEDPAATIGAIWDAELRDLQDNSNNDNDNQRNNDAAEAQRSALQQAEASSTTTSVAAEATSSAAAESSAAAPQATA